MRDICNCFLGGARGGTIPRARTRAYAESSLLGQAVGDPICGGRMHVMQAKTL